jgi:hypothetical protein
MNSDRINPILPPGDLPLLPPGYNKIDLVTGYEMDYLFVSNL